jgi:hypothetical protein
MVGEAAADEV